MASSGSRMDVVAGSGSIAGVGTIVGSMAGSDLGSSSVAGTKFIAGPVAGAGLKGSSSSASHTVKEDLHC